MSTGVDDDEILDVLRGSDEPELTTTAIADELPISRGRTRTRLQSLVDDGHVERRRVGNNIVWWLPERDDERASTDDDAESGTGAEDESDADEEPSEADDTGDESDDESGPEAVEVEVVGSDADETTEAEGAEAEGTADESVAVEASEEPTEKPATATGSGGVEDDAASVEVESAGDDVTVRIRENGSVPARDDGNLTRLLGVAAVALLALALLRRLRRR